MIVFIIIHYYSLLFIIIHYYSLLFIYIRIILEDIELIPPHGGRDLLWDLLGIDIKLK